MTNIHSENKIIASQFLIFAFLPYLYFLLNNGFTYKFYTLSNPILTITIYFFVFISALIIPIKKIVAFKLNVNTLNNLFVFILFLYFLISLLLPSNYRYSDNVVSIYKIPFKLLYFFIISIIVLHFNVISKVNKFITLTILFVTFSGIGTALTILFTSLLFFPRLKMSYLILFFIPLFSYGVFIKTGSMDSLADGVFVIIAVGIERISANFVAADFLINNTINDYQYGKVIFDTFINRFNDVKNIEFSNLAHYVRMSLSSNVNLTNDEGGMPTSVIGSFFYIFHFFGIIFSIVYFVFIKSFFMSFKNISWVQSIAIVWNVQFVFSNIGDMFSILTPNFLALIIFFIVGVIKVEN